MSDHKPSDRRRAAKQEEIKLNLLPFMNLMTLLIPFLLVSIQFVTLSVIDSSLPAIGQPQPQDKKEDDKPPLNLTIGITDEGFTVAGSAKVLGCDKNAGGDKDKCTTVPKTSDQAYCESTVCRGDPECNAAQQTPCHDFKALRDLVVQVKETDADGDGNADYVEDCSDTPTPEVCNVIIAPNPTIRYAVIVGVMDATRDHMKDGETERTDLFPYVVVAGGVK